LKENKYAEQKAKIDKQYDKAKKYINLIKKREVLKKSRNIIIKLFLH
jgi:hypothetical protein